MGSSEVGALQACLPEEGFVKVSVEEVGTSQVRTTKIGSLQIYSSEVGLLQVCLSEIGSFHMRIRELSMFEVCPFQIGLLQEQRGHGTLALSKIFALLPRDIAERTRKWKILKVHASQVGTTQVQSRAFALTLIAPIDRSAPVLVGCQQPFDIGTTQCNVLKGIDTLFEIRRNGAAYCQVILAFRINLQFGAPGLSLYRPVSFP